MTKVAGISGNSSRTADQKTENQVSITKMATGLLLGAMLLAQACQSQVTPKQPSGFAEHTWLPLDSAPTSLRDFVGGGALVAEDGSERVGCPRGTEKRSLSVVSSANWEFRQLDTALYSVRVLANVIGEIELLRGGYTSYRLTEIARTDTNEFEARRNSVNGWSAHCGATHNYVRFAQVNDPGMYVNPDVLRATAKRLNLTLGAKP